jgi:valyl-tRNA synthetase
MRIKTNYKGSEAEMKKAVNVQKSSFPKGIPACGTDALRFTLCSHNAKGK